MELLPPAVRATLPALYAQEKADDPIAYVKFFTPWTNWTWYATEGSPEGDDFTLFGFIVGQSKELGYFSLNEMQKVRGPGGLTIERDLYFNPVRLSEVKKLHP